MQRVFVIDKNQQPLMPCLSARARQLLQQGKAAIWRRFPFTIILKAREGGAIQPIEFKADPGSKTTGMALVGQFRKGRKVLWAAHLQHRGEMIKAALRARQQIRRSRRTRKTRYRLARFDNRHRQAQWLPPSLCSRVDNILHWLSRLRKWAPIERILVETARFDMQKMENPEISGAEYQKGTLQGYEVREYLLCKYRHQCQYCHSQDIPLEIDHVVPRSQGGSDRLSNLILACHACNQAKGNRPLEEFLAQQPQRLQRIQAGLKQPLKDAAALNATRIILTAQLQQQGLPVETHTGSLTKFNRTRQGYPKSHWIDAACVGGEAIFLQPHHIPFHIQAKGRGSRQACRMDRYGFPRTGAKGAKAVHGFQTGDMIRAFVPKGKKAGFYTGRVAVRSSGYFNIQTTQAVWQGIGFKYCQRLHRTDGYLYQNQHSQKGDGAPPRTQARGFRAHLI